MEKVNINKQILFFVVYNSKKTDINIYKNINLFFITKNKNFYIYGTYHKITKL
jgi:hypothetical protein